MKYRAERRVKCIIDLKMDEILAAISENMSVSSACDQSHGWDKWMPDHTYNATALRKHYTHIHVIANGYWFWHDANS